MNNWRIEIATALDDFIEVASLANESLQRDAFQVEFLVAPHRSPILPKGMMGIYGFWYDGEWLKIGKAGPKSRARFTSQHYLHTSSQSNLAKSLRADPNMFTVPGFDLDQVGEWIRASTNRLSIYLSISHSPALLSLLEAFLHVRLHPRYEG